MLVTQFSALFILVCSCLVAQGIPLERRAKLPGKGLPPAKFPPAKPVPSLTGAAPPPVTPVAAPPSAAGAAICAKATTCDACIKLKFQGGACGFTFASPNTCVPVVANQKLATNAAQCKSIATSNAAAAANSNDAVRATAAANIFSGIAGHVFQGRADKKTSGRHLATTWIKANGEAGLVNNAATSIQTFPFGQKKTKTVWNDNATTGKYTQAIATKMCTDAIVASMVANKNSLTTPLSGESSFSVASFAGGPNICVTFSGASCFPDPVATNAALGQTCTPSNKGQDNDE